MLRRDLKSLQLLWLNLAGNHRYSSFIESSDLLEFEIRVANEGLPFLTVALPELGKALDCWHSTHELPSFSSFKTDENGVPRFLGKPFRAALEGNSVAVDCVRQLSYVFYKLEVPHEESAIEEHSQKFISNDCGLVDIDFGDDSYAWLLENPFGSSDREDRGAYAATTRLQLVNEMARLIKRVLCNSNPRNIRPCHGTGSTACHTPNHKKWATIRYYEKLDQVYDYATHFYFSPTHLADEMQVMEHSLTREPRARVCFVPKDSRGPRVISCEPAELMYIQQGIMRLLYDTLETNNLTRGQINFIDQGVNRKLAYQASKDGSMATIDLKDASDMISLELVRRVFPADWVECLEACRSEETILPNGTVVKLNKFAPMGSSCCFPVEALVFWACARATTHILCGQLFGLGVKSPHLNNWTRPIYVYGDDIICDSRFARAIMDGLEIIGLKINRQKSYVDGPFRESCGGDYHNGYDVTPVRVRHVPSNVGTGLVVNADLANSFIAKFGYETSHPIIRLIEEVVGYCYPRTDMDIPMTIRNSPSAINDVVFKRRWNSGLQRYEHRVLSSSALALQRRPPDWWELLRRELTRERLEKSYPYENRFSVIDAQLDPGQYVDLHSTQIKWTWRWLG